MKNFSRLLEILEVDVNKLYPITKPVKFKNIILPDESFFLDKSKFHVGEGNFTVDGTWDNFDGNDGSYFTREYLDTVAQLRAHIQKNFSPLSQKKFYFFHGKENAGEERIARYFQSKGYEILRPELIPIDEQLNLFANCENFASLCGSVSHNVIFLPDNANVILIPRRAAYLNIYQQALNHVHNLDCYYIDSAFSIFSPKWTGPFCYIVSENLKKYFGDDVTEKYTEEDFETFLAYVRYAKAVGLQENPQELEYLKNILPEFMEQLRTKTDLIQKFGITVN